jgi:hypothetical protein
MAGAAAMAAIPALSRAWSKANLELLLGQNWLRLFKETIG